MKINKSHWDLNKETIMRIVLFFMTILYSLNLFACADNFNGTFIEKESGTSTLEIKVLDCAPTLELSFPSENRKGQVIADDADRLIWNQNGRTISEKAFIKDNALNIVIVDKDIQDTFYQNQTYRLTEEGLELFIEIFNTNHSRSSKKHISYVQK